MNDLLDDAPALQAIPVSQLNRQVKNLLERGIARLWVEGEISNLARPASGHLYFSLKDDAAQVRAAFFRQRQRGPTIGLKNGDHVLVYGRVSLYEPRGDYQLIVERVEAAGEGALKREFDRLKLKLQAEGLFDANRKRPLPALPHRIGVITSPSGAAVRDILTVLRRRFPAVPVTIYPSSVQGDAAPAELRAALAKAIARGDCDVLILARGGGSLEDLWAFNDEALARDIAQSPIPTVSAVGHEVDFTIADFVADVRAPTPSGAAELVVPDSTDWLHRIGQLAARVTRAGRNRVEEAAQNLDWLGRRLAAASPAGTVARQRNWLRELGGRLAAAVRHDLLARGQRLQRQRNALLRASPAIRVERARSRERELRQRLVAAGRHHLEDRQHRLTLAMRALHSVSPLATLERGYAVVMDADTGSALLDASATSTGKEIRAKLHKGELRATVTKVGK